MADNHKTQLEIGVDASGAKDELRDLARVAGETSKTMRESGEQAKTGLDGYGDKVKKETVKVEEADSRIIASLQRKRAAVEAAGKGETAYQEQLLKNRGLNVDLYRTELDALKAAEQARAVANNSLGSIGNTAKQTTAALRQVPMQFTDIIVSLQGGQKPMQVLLQQGGQLKDMFGGVGQAAKAMGGYVLGLINPFTIAAATIGGLAYAYSQGAGEQKQFRETLILTGNQAGTTAEQLSAMARSASAISGATQGRAAEVLNEIAKSGGIGAANMQRFAAAALEFERVGGPAAEETAKAFASLSKTPLESALKLNEATGFLTKATLDSIKTLEDQGRTVEAARVAQEAYFSAINDRTPEMLRNLGLIERAWLGIKDESKKAWDAFFNIGRPTSTPDVIQNLRDRIDLNNSMRPRGAGANEDIDRRNASLQKQIDLLERGLIAEQDAAKASGEHAKNINLAATWAKEGDKYLSNQSQMEREITRAKAEGDQLVASGLIQQIELNNRLNAIREKYKDKGTPGNPNAGDQEAAKEWAKWYEKLSKDAADAEAKTLGLTKAQGDLLEMLKSPRYKDWTDQMKLVNVGISQAAIASEQLAEANKKAFEEQQKQAKSTEQYIKQLDQRAIADADVAQMASDYAKSVDELNAKTQLEISLMGMGNVARNATIAQYEIELNLQKQILDIKKKLASQEEQDKAIAAVTETAERAKAGAVFKAYVDEEKRVSQQIEQSITDALMRGFESGKGFAENLRDAVANMFKTLVLRPVVSAIVQPVAGQFASYLTGGNSLAGGINTANSAYNLASAGASIWGSNAAYGAALGTTSIGAGSQAAMLASQTSIFGAEGASLTAAAAGNAGTASIMSSLSAAGPYIAAAAAIYMIAKSLDNSGTPHTGGSSSFSAASGLSLGQGVYGVGPKGSDYSAQTEALTSGVTQSIVGILDSTAVTFGKQAGYSAAAAFADDSSSDGAWGALTIKLRDKLVAGFGQDGNGRWPGASFADGQAGSAEYLAKVSSDVRAALDQIGLPGWATDMLNQLGEAPALDQLAKTVAMINVTQSALVNLGNAMPQLQGLADETVRGLLAAFGGIENLAKNAGSYYENFYSEAEKAAATTQQITDSLSALGYSLPATREGFRALVEAQDLTTQAGRDTYAALLNLSPAFASVVKATEALADGSIAAAEKMAEAGRKALADLAKDTGNLLVDLLNAQGDKSGAKSLARQNALASITNGLSETDAAAAIAAYDYNQTLRDQIVALGEAADAQRKAESDYADAQRKAQSDAEQAIAEAKARADAVFNEAYGLTTRLLTLQGDTATLRKRELEALDPSNRALLEQINALQDQQTAAQAAAQALQSLTGTLDNLGSTRVDLQAQLLGLNGNAAEAQRIIRERDLAKLTAGMNAEDAARVTSAYDLNQALRDQITQTQEAQKAAEELARAQEQAANDAARAAQQFKDAWQSVANTIFDEVARIRGLVAGTSPLSFANAQAQFAITSAQARSGDQEAAKLLPGLSNTLLSLAEAQATSLLELQRIRSQTAESLNTTGSLLSGMFGLQIPRLATGTNYIPQDMLVFAHQGEAVIPAPYNPANSGAQQDYSVIVSELQSLRKEARENARALAELQLREVQVIEQWDGDGMPGVRK